ncbi:hypothetical protein DS66_07470 [Mesotoga sp. SC_3PWM13N19]|nr:hypothetical protein DS66_07470 [Mesotoga sp. SC_3PWM13N19]
MILSYRDLRVWQESMNLVTDVYKATESFLKNEMFGLSAQLRRAVVSVPSNIAEGSARKGKKELLNFLHIAKGSLAEATTQLEIAKRLGFLSDESFGKLIEKGETIAKMINSLIRSLNRKEE